MAGVSVTINTGDLKKATDNITFFRFQLKKDIKRITDTHGLLIESTAKELAPVDTGRLRASIHYDAQTGQVSTNVVYASFMELGTVRHRAQPFLFPAAERWRQSYLNAVKAAILRRG
jgi:phage gpG-like protein